MARSSVRDVLDITRADGSRVVGAGATATVVQPGTATPIGVPVYRDATGSTEWAGGVVTADNGGNIRFYLDAPADVDLLCAAAGMAPFTLEDVQVLPPASEVISSSSTSTLTNKTLSSPTINNPTISGGTIVTGDGSSGSPSFKIGAAGAGGYTPGANQISWLGSFRFGDAGAPAAIVELMKNDTASSAQWDQAAAFITAPRTKVFISDGFPYADQIRPGDLAPYDALLSVARLIPSTATIAGAITNPRKAGFSSAFQALIRNESSLASGIPAVAGYFQAHSIAGSGWAINTLFQSTRGASTVGWGIELNSNITNADTYQAIDIIGDTRYGAIPTYVYSNDFFINTDGSNAIGVRVQPLGFQSTAFLNAGINNSVTSLVVTHAPTPAYAVPFRILVDSEVMTVTAVAGTTWTVTRAAEGTAAASHSAAATIFAPVIPFSTGVYLTPGATTNGVILSTALENAWTSVSQPLTFHSRNGSGTLQTGTIRQHSDGGYLYRPGGSIHYFQNSSGASTYATIDASGITTALAIVAAAISGTTGTFSGAISGTSVTASAGVNVGSASGAATGELRTSSTIYPGGAAAQSQIGIHNYAGAGTLANNATISLGIPMGILVVTDHAGSKACVVALNGNAQTLTAVSASTTGFVIGTDSGADIAIYWEAGANEYRIKNRSGSNAFVAATLIGDVAA